MSQSYLCGNCGDAIYRNGGNTPKVLPPHCAKRECRAIYAKLRYGRRKETDKELPPEEKYNQPFKTPEKYAVVEFNAVGEAVKPDIFQKLVDGNGRTCDDCRWNDNCKARVVLGLWIACESPAKHERELVENSPELLYNLTKLSTVVTG